MRAKLVETMVVEAPRAVLQAGTRGEVAPLYEGSPLLLFRPDGGKRRIVVRLPSIRVLVGSQP